MKTWAIIGGGEAIYMLPNEKRVGPRQTPFTTLPPADKFEPGDWLVWQNGSAVVCIVVELPEAMLAGSTRGLSAG